MRSWALGALWVVASIGAVSIAWAGVGVVNSEVIAPPPASVVPLVTDIASADLGTDDIPVDEQASGTTSPTTESGSDDSSTTSTSTTTTTTTTAQPASAGQQSDSGGSTTGDNSQSSSTTVPTTSTVPDTASTSTLPTTSTTVSAGTPDPDAPAETQTFKLTGGSARISFSASGVTLVWATPETGFGVVIEDQSPGLKVEFRSEDHRSRLDAWWAGGPVWTIEERES